MHKRCEKCGRQFPWGITAFDGVCFICRWPSLWSDKDEQGYRAKLKATVPVKAPVEKEG